MIVRWLPNHSQTLLLQAALLSGQPAEDAFSQWRSTVDLDHTDGGSFRLLPLLLRSIEVRGDDHPGLDRIRGVYRRSVYTSTMLRSMAGSVIGALEHGGVHPVVINGAAIAHLAYNDSATRPLGDVDLFVTGQEFSDAVGIIEQLGFVGTGARRDAERDASLVVGTALNRGPAEKLRLHTTLRGFGLDPTFDQRALGRASVHPEGHVRRTLDPTDHLLRTLSSAAHDRYIPNCRWAADATLLVRHGGPIDWHRLNDDADALGVTLGVREALGYLDDHLQLGLPTQARRAIDTIRISPLGRVHHWVRSTPATRRTSAVRVLLTDYRCLAAGSPIHEGIRDYPGYLAGRIAERKRTVGQSTFQALRHGPQRSG